MSTYEGNRLRNLVEFGHKAACVFSAENGNIDSTFQFMNFFGIDPVHIIVGREEEIFSVRRQGALSRERWNIQMFVEANGTRPLIETAFTIYNGRIVVRP